MKKPTRQDDLSIVEDLIGLKGKSIQKSYFPQLQGKINELRREQDKYQSVYNNVINGIIRLDKDGWIVDYNPAMARILGLSKGESRRFPGEILTDLIIWEDLQNRCLAGEYVRYDEIHLKNMGNEPLSVSLKAHLISQDSRELMELFIEDITERLQVENRLRQSQKMDAIGKLAGGVAHDFNNLLSSIIGAADLILEESGEKQINEYAGMIIEASEMAANMTSKLLSFSRSTGKEFVQVSLTNVVLHSKAILERTLDKKITVHFQGDEKKYLIKGSKPELENCLLNIGINAGQAMPNGGDLTFSLSEVSLGPEECRRLDFDISPGFYYILDCRDTGVGMTIEHRNKIFEPFYTTRELGKGTGLGLATVYGIVGDHGGAIGVESIPGKGTLFSLYFPRSAESK